MYSTISSLIFQIASTLPFQHEVECLFGLLPHMVRETKCALRTPCPGVVVLVFGSSFDILNTSWLKFYFSFNENVFSPHQRSYTALMTTRELGSSSSWISTIKVHPIPLTRNSDIWNFRLFGPFLAGPARNGLSYNKIFRI